MSGGGGDAADDSDDEEDDVEGGGEGAVADALSMDSTGEVAWDHIVEKVKTAEATAANIRSNDLTAADAKKRPRFACTLLPVSLLLFLLPPLLLAPFYVSVYATSITGVANVLESQVRLGVSQGVV